MSDRSKTGRQASDYEGRLAGIIKNSARSRTNAPAIAASTGNSGITPRQTTHRSRNSDPANFTTYRSNRSDVMHKGQLNVDSDREIDMTTARRPLAIDEVSGSGIGTASGSESSELSFSAKSDESRFLQYVIEPMKPQHVACFCREDGSTCIRHNQAYPRLVEVVRLTNQMVKECRDDDATMAELLQQLDTEVDESLVARQDTFKQKVVKAYCRRAEEAQMLRKQLDVER